MAKSPLRLTGKFDSASVHKMVRYMLALGVFASLVITVVYATLTSNAMNEVQNEGSNPYNASDTSLSDNEQNYQVNANRYMFALAFSFLLTLMYIAMKV